ncbi:MAG: FAD-dependent oxidoreductase, partial [Steroidobacteraceae bacterium]
MSDTTFDLVVIGSGAAGLSAAVTGAVLGMSVLVLEKLAVFGGTTATSGGTLWMPGNPIAPRRNIEDSTARALRYLHCEPGVQLDEAQAHAFLCAVPAALEFFERNTELRFALDGHVSDYHTDAPDALAIGRSLVARPFDGARLGRRFAALAQPLRSLTLGGMPMEHGRPLLDLMHGALNLRALAFLTRTMFAHGLDRMRHGRAARLYGGQALAARL